MQYVLMRDILLAFYCYTPYPFMFRTIPDLSKKPRRERFAIVLEAWLYFYALRRKVVKNKKEDFRIVEERTKLTS